MLNVLLQYGQVQLNGDPVPRGIRKAIESKLFEHDLDAIQQK